MPTITLTPTACTQSGGFTNLYYYGNTSNLRQLIFTFANNAELAAGGVAITNVTFHYRVRNSSSVAKQLAYGFKTGTSVAPTAFASLEGTSVLEGKFTAIPGVSKQTTKNATKSYGEGSILVDWLLQEMQAGNPVYLGVIQPTSGNSIQVDATLSYWTMDVTYEIRGNIPTTDTDTVKLGEKITINVERVLSDSTTVLEFSLGDSGVLDSQNLGTDDVYEYEVYTDWGPSFSDSLTGILTIAAVTYVDGVEYGTVTTSVTVTLPGDAAPVFETTAASRRWLDSVPATSRIDAYVQTVTGFDLAYMVGAQYGASLASVSMTCEGATYSATSLAEMGTLTHPAFSASGTIQWTITATDTRGLSASATGSLTVLPWSTPKIQSFTINRATEAGVQAIDGTYALAAVKASVSSLTVSGTEENKLSFIVCAREIDSETETWTTFDTVTGSTISGTFSGLLTQNSASYDGFNDMSGYEFKLIVSDLFGSSTAYDTMPTKAVYLDVDETTGYMGFGGDAPTSDEGVGYRFHNPIDVPIGSYLDRYSTEPTPIGTWIDGRTIYRQVWDVGTVTTTSSGNVTTVLVSGTPTFDALVRLEVYGRWGTSGTNLIQIPRIWTTTTGTLSVDYNANTIRMRSINNVAFTLSNVVVVAEYLVSETTASLDWGDDTDTSTDPDDTDAIAELEAKVTSLQAQINELKKEG